MSDILRQIQCVKREIVLRKSVYPNLVSRGKMKPAVANYELEGMMEVLATLERLKLNENL